MTMHAQFPHPVTGLAIDPGVDPVDLITVAQAELSPDDFDDDTMTMTDAGHAALLSHFNGGADPYTEIHVL